MFKKIFSISIFLSACSVSHEVRIPIKPCLYPYKDYNFTLCQNFKFKVGNNKYFIPRGFATDLASIPRILWPIYAPTRTETIPGAIIHDFLYFCPGSMSRIEADSIFYDALIYEGIPKKTAFRYWVAVRLFGSSHFNKGATCTRHITIIANTKGYHRYLRMVA